MQAVYQNLYIWLRHLTVTYAVLLHCTRPHTSSGTATDVGLRVMSQALQLLQMFISPFSVIPYRTFYVLFLRKTWHAFKEFFVIYRVIHKSLRDFRTRLRNNQDRHGRKEHINR